MNLVLPPGGKYMQQSAEEFLVSIMNWLYNRNIISVQHCFVVCGYLLEWEKSGCNDHPQDHWCYGDSDQAVVLSAC
jgi:hypothetical protein